MSKPRKSKPVHRIDCTYCGRPCEFVTGKAIYPNRPDLHRLKFYRCAPCDAYVGAHKSDNRPLGLPANRALRHARIQAHAAFDPLWMTGPFARASAYDWVAKTLGLSKKDAHIGHFNLEQCRRLIEAVRALKTVPAVYKFTGTARTLEDCHDAARTGGAAGLDREPEADGEDGGGAGEA